MNETGRQKVDSSRKKNAVSPPLHFRTHLEMLRAIVADADTLEASADTICFTSGNTYVGSLLDGATMGGAAVFTWGTDATTFKGTFEQNVIAGEGVYTWPDGSTYVGHVAGGLRHGVGTFVAAGGSPRYEGEWKAGRRHGKGRLEYTGGDVYEGEWADDVRHGHGMLTHASGNTYVGAWAGDAKNGQGTFRWSDRREQYVGEWKDGRAHGQGEHSWLRPQLDANPFQLRERYVGEWRHGQRHGHGTFYLASGARYVGEWCANAKHGVGLFSFEDGSLYEGLFEADRMTDGQLRATSELFTYLDLAHLLPAADVEATCTAVRRVLIRHNTDIKQAYRFYSSLGRVAEDAFDLTLAQFRTFAVDAQLVCRTLPVVDLDHLVMRSAASQPPARSLPRPLVLAITVAAARPAAGEVSEVRAARKYVRGGAHDGGRTLLLREFVQGLVDIAAAKLQVMPLPACAEPTPTPPLARALIDMIMSITSVTPSSLEAPTSDDALAVATGGEGDVETLRSRLQLAYGFYAAQEVTCCTAPQSRASRPPSRHRTGLSACVPVRRCGVCRLLDAWRVWQPPGACGRMPNEPTLSVRGLVQMLTDGKLLPRGFNLQQLLLTTLPSYYLPARTSSLANSPLGEEACMLGSSGAAVPEDRVESSSPVESGDSEAGAAVQASAPTDNAVTAILSDDELVELLELRLIYSEFEQCAIAFAERYAAPMVPPWLPPPPAPTLRAHDASGEGPEEASGTEAPRDAQLSVAQSASGADADGGPNAATVLRDEVLPRVGGFLMARLEKLASAAA